MLTSRGPQFPPASNARSIAPCRVCTLHTSARVRAATLKQSQTCITGTLAHSTERAPKGSAVSLFKLPCLRRLSQRHHHGRLCQHPGDRNMDALVGGHRAGALSDVSIARREERRVPADHALCNCRISRRMKFRSWSSLQLEDYLMVVVAVRATLPTLSSPC